MELKCSKTLGVTFEIVPSVQNNYFELPQKAGIMREERQVRPLTCTANCEAPKVKDQTLAISWSEFLLETETRAGWVLYLMYFETGGSTSRQATRGKWAQLRFRSYFKYPNTSPSVPTNLNTNIQDKTKTSTNEIFAGQVRFVVAEQRSSLARRLRLSKGFSNMRMMYILGTRMRGSYQKPLNRGIFQMSLFPSKSLSRRRRVPAWR